MSYVINRTDQNGAILLTLLDGTADGPNINPGASASDINLFGKNYPLYGEFQNENFIKLLQNFAGATAPTKPLPGELWYDTTTGFLKVYTGTTFTPVSPVIVANTAPTTTVSGAEWWDQANRQLSTWNGSSWTLVGPAYKYTDGKSGPIVEVVADTVGGTHTVTKFYQQNNVIAIANFDAQFTLSPANPVAGFSTIKPGITLATGLANEYTFVGDATNSKMLGNIAAANYARIDIVPTFTSNIAVTNGAINIGETGGAGFVKENTVNANLSLAVNLGGVSTDAITVRGSDAATFINKNLYVNGATVTIVGDVSIGGNTTVHGTTSGGVTGIGKFVFDASPTLTGIPFAPNAAVGTVTAQIATTAFTNTAIATSSHSPWQGSHKIVSTNTPDNGVGNVGDFWFQI